MVDINQTVRYIKRNLGIDYLFMNLINGTNHVIGEPQIITDKRTRLAYRICKLQTAASAVGCGWMWSEKLNNRKSDGRMTGDVCYKICTIDRSQIKIQK